MCISLTRYSQKVLSALRSEGNKVRTAPVVGAPVTTVEAVIVYSWWSPSRGAMDQEVCCWIHGDYGIRRVSPSPWGCHLEDNHGRPVLIPDSATASAVAELMQAAELAAGFKGDYQVVAL